MHPSIFVWHASITAFHAQCKRQNALRFLRPGITLPNRWLTRITTLARASATTLGVCATCLSLYSITYHRERVVKSLSIGSRVRYVTHMNARSQVKCKSDWQNVGRNTGTTFQGTSLKLSRTRVICSFFINCQHTPKHAHNVCMPTLATDVIKWYLIRMPQLSWEAYCPSMLISTLLTTPGSNCSRADCKRSKANRSGPWIYTDIIAN